MPQLRWGLPCLKGNMRQICQLVPQQMHVRLAQTCTKCWDSPNDPAWPQAGSLGAAPSGLSYSAKGCPSGCQTACRQFPGHALTAFLLDPGRPSAGPSGSRKPSRQPCWPFLLPSAPWPHYFRFLAGSHGHVAGLSASAGTTWSGGHGREHSPHYLPDQMPWLPRHRCQTWYCYPQA